MYPSSFRTWAIEDFSFEAGIATDSFSDICALRMRVSMSEIGSLILMQFSPASLESPAGLDDARDFPAHRDFAKLVAPQTEFPVRAARASGKRAAVAHP